MRSRAELRQSRLELARDALRAATQCLGKIYSFWASGLVIFTAGFSFLLFQWCPTGSEESAIPIPDSPPHIVLVRGAWNPTRPPAAEEETAEYEDESGCVADAADRTQDHDSDLESGATLEAAPNQAAAPVAYTRHRVKKGESLWRIAERYLGNGGAWRRICDANPELGKDGKRLRSGMELNIPVSSASVARRASDPDTNARDESAVARVYVVRRGDDLYTIARSFRPRDGWRWLYDANRRKIPDPKRLRVGTELTIPPRRGDRKL